MTTKEPPMQDSRTVPVVEKLLFVRQFLLSEYAHAAAEAEGLPVDREAMPAWDALHEALPIVEQLVEAAQEARVWLCPPGGPKGPPDSPITAAILKLDTVLTKARGQQ